MANLVEVLLKAIDGVTPVVKEIDKETAKANKAMKEKWDATGLALQGVGVAMLAVGAGIEMMARANAPLIESTRRLADYLDMTEKEMKDLVLATSNVTFPLNEVLTLMETGSKLGLESAESLKKYAEFWDMVGDATEESSTALAESGTALKALGIEVGEEGKALNAFGFIQRNTTMDVKEFIDMVGRLAPEMNELGLGVDGAAVIMGILQTEMGYTSRVAITEFRRAVTESGGDLEELKRLLGITSDMFGTFSQKVKESSEVISENARRNNELVTSGQKVQHWLSELKYEFYESIAGAANYSFALGGIGSAMTIVGTIMKSSFFPAIVGATKAVWAFTASILANPLTFWIGVIGLVITSLVLLWKNWENITEWISRKVDWIVDKFQWLGDKIKWVAEKLGIYKEKTIEIAEATDTLKESGDEASESIDGIKTSSEGAGEAVGNLAEGNIALGESLDGIAEKAKIASDGIKLYADDVAENYVALAGRATDSWDDFYAFWEAEAKRTAGEINQTVTTVIDKMGVAHKVWTDIKEEVKTGKESNLYKQVSKEGKTLGLQSGNIISQAMKEEGVTLVKLHEGSWKVKTAVPGGEGIAVLKDTEVISQEGKGGWKGATNQINLEIKAGAFQFNANKLDEGVIRNSGKIIFDEIWSQFRAHGIVLQRG